MQEGSGGGLHLQNPVESFSDSHELAGVGERRGRGVQKKSAGDIVPLPSPDSSSDFIPHRSARMAAHHISQLSNHVFGEGKGTELEAPHSFLPLGFGLQPLNAMHCFVGDDVFNVLAHLLLLLQTHDAQVAWQGCGQSVEGDPLEAIGRMFEGTRDPARWFCSPLRTVSRWQGSRTASAEETCLEGMLMIKFSCKISSITSWSA